MKKITGSPFFDPVSGGTLWNVSYVLAFAGENEIWRKRILNAGYNQLDGSGNRVPIVLHGGLQPSRPCLLDESGVYMEASSSDPADAVQLEFQVYYQINFASAFGFEGNVDFGEGY